MANRDSYSILDWTENETEVFVSDHGSGPTIVVLGGVHGNEIAGVRAARLVRLWSLRGGQLVVIPEAAKTAFRGLSGFEETRRNFVEGGEREGNDLNRDFPVGSDPTSVVARNLWAEIAGYDPDYVIDLHTSHGLSDGRNPSGVGQCIFTDSSGSAAYNAAQASEDHLNDHVPSNIRDTHDYRASDAMSLPTLIRKVNEDLDGMGWIVEATRDQQVMDVRVEQLEHAVETLLYHATDGDVQVESYGHDDEDSILAEYGNGGGGGDDGSSGGGSDPDPDDELMGAIDDAQEAMDRAEELASQD